MKLSIWGWHSFVSGIHGTCVQKICKMHSNVHEISYFVLPESLTIMIIKCIKFCSQMTKSQYSYCVFLKVRNNLRQLRISWKKVCGHPQPDATSFKWQLALSFYCNKPFVWAAWFLAIHFSPLFLEKIQPLRKRVPWIIKVICEGGCIFNIHRNYYMQSKI